MEREKWWESLKPGDELLLRGDRGRELQKVKYKKTTPSGIIRVDGGAAYINNLSFKVVAGKPTAKYGSGWHVMYYELRQMDAKSLEEWERAKLISGIHQKLYGSMEQTLRGLSVEDLRTMAGVLKVGV